MTATFCDTRFAPFDAIISTTILFASQGTRTRVLPLGGRPEATVGFSCLRQSAFAGMSNFVIVAPFRLA
ncbi:MAG: hypothetical protein WD757_07045 [Actinomycetota bacterium]